MGKENKISFAKVQSIFFFGLITVLSIAMLYIIHPFIYPIFWAAITAVIFYPVHSWLKDHLGVPNISSLLSILLIIAVVFLPLTLISILIANQSLVIYKEISSNGQYAQQLLGFFDFLKTTQLAPYVEQAQTEIIQRANELVKTITLTLINSAQQITSASIRFAVQFAIMIYTLFYFLKDGPKMLKRLMHLSPLEDQYEKKLYEKFTATASATLKSTLIIGGIQGTLGGLTFWLAGIKAALIWGVIMVIIAIIPSLGAAIIMLPAAIVLGLIGNMLSAVIVLIGAVIVSLIDNFLRPPLIGKDIEMHPLLVLFSTLGGLVIFGISGFIIGPIIASLFLAIISIYDYYYKQELDHNH